MLSCFWNFCRNSISQPSKFGFQYSNHLKDISVRDFLYENFIKNAFLFLYTSNKDQKICGYSYKIATMLNWSNLKVQCDQKRVMVLKLAIEKWLWDVSISQISSLLIICLAFAPLLRTFCIHLFWWNIFGSKVIVYSSTRILTWCYLTSERQCN